MRKKELCFVVALHTTTEALALEAASHQAGVVGRLIPIPTQITAGCGLAWKMPITARADMEQLLQENHLYYDGTYELWV